MPLEAPAPSAPAFWTDGPVPPALSRDLVFGRADLVERLRRRWRQRAPVRTLLVGPPLSGRRTTLRASLREVNSPLAVIRIDVQALVPATGRGLAEAILKALRGRISVSRWNQAAKDLRHPDEAEAAATLADVDTLLAGLPKEERPFVVFEGAEHLTDLPDATLQGLEAWAAGSSAHIVLTVAHVPSRLKEYLPSLCGTAGVRETRLEPVARQSAATFLGNRLAHARCQARPEAAALLLEFAAGDPASLQWLGRHLVDHAKRQTRGLVTLDDAVEAIAEAVATLPWPWVGPLGALSGRLRDVFVALAFHDAASITDVGERIHLDAKNVSVLLSRLIDRGYPVEKVARGRYRISHRLIREHVRARFGEG